LGKELGHGSRISDFGRVRQDREKVVQALFRAEG
jgi:hypothetical protein